MPSSTSASPTAATDPPSPLRADARRNRERQLRADVTVDDVLDLVSAIAWVTEQGPRNHPDRLLSIALDGLRP